MPSRVHALTGKLIESAWLAAIVVVPILMNVHSARTFEEDKIPLLRSLAVVVLVGLIVRVCEDGRAAWQAAREWRQPLVAAALLLTATYALATICSIAPLLSLLGSYHRMQGLYTWAGYITIFVALVVVLRRPAQRERLITAILLASLPTALYAIVQHVGGDPIRWTLDVRARALSTAGNAIFLSAYLIMVVPLTLARIIGQIDVMRARPSDRRRADYLSSLIVAAAYASLLIVQVLAIAYSNSRGPVLGLGIGLILFSALLARQRGVRWLSVSILGLATASAILVTAIVWPGGPFTSVRQLPSFERAAAMLDTSGGTGRVRVLVWGGAVELLAATTPLRALVGYGPEALYLAYLPHYPAELGHYESHKVAADRAHNETFDALIMTGVLGWLAEMAVVLAFFVAALRATGVIATPRQRRWFLTAAALGSLLGGLLPYLAEGSFRFSGLALPIGTIAGVVVYLFADSLTPPRRINPAPSGVLTIALLAAASAHFVEIQFGIAMSLTRLLFWTYAGLLVSLAMPRSEAEPDLVEQASPASDPVGLGLLVALIGVLLTFDFYVPSFTAWTQRNVLLIGAVVCLWAGVLVVADTPPPDGRRGRRLVRYIVSALGPWMVFTAVYVWWVNWRPNPGVPRDVAVELAQHTSHVISLVYLAVVTIVVLLTTVLNRTERSTAAATPTPLWRAAAYVAVLLAAAFAIVATNLDVSRADIVSKQVQSYLRRGALMAARRAAEEALRMQPWNDHYATDLGSIFMDLARNAAPARRVEYLTQAQQVLERAEHIGPLNVDNPRNLARLHHLWATLVEDPGEQTQHFEAAERFHDLATRLSPMNASLWNEWALLCIARHQTDRALALLDHSLEIDNLYPTTNWLRANIYMERQMYEQALADYERALSFKPRLLAAWSGKALALTRLNRFDDAIAANRSALAVNPNDLISHRNLALLYRQTNQLDLALSEAKAALAAAVPPDDEPLKTFIAQLQEQLASGQ